MTFSISDSIAKKIFVLVGIPIIACLIVAAIGLVSLKVVDRALSHHQVRTWTITVNF